jgi:hypothetical protein
MQRRLDSHEIIVGSNGLIAGEKKRQYGERNNGEKDREPEHEKFKGR